MGATFTFSNPRVSPTAVYPAEEIVAAIDMTNTGDTAGSRDVHLTGWWTLTRLAWPNWNGGQPPVPLVQPGQTLAVDFHFAPSPTHPPREDCPVYIEGMLCGYVDVLGSTPPPGGFTFSNLRISPASVYPGELITVTVRATNTSSVPSSSDVHLTGWWVLTTNTGSVPAGGSVDVVFEFRPSIGATPGIRDIIVEGLAGTVEVLATQQDYGTITVSANLPAVDVYVDGALEGNTSLGPLVVTREPGSHEVSFGLMDGYTTPPAQNVTVVAGANVNVYGTYTPISTDTGMLLIFTTPVGATVFLNGIEAGTTQPGVVLELELEVGGYTINFGAVSGYTTPVPQTVTITAGGEVSVLATYHPSGVTGDKPWLIPAAVGLGIVGLVVISKMKKG